MRENLRLGFAGARPTSTEEQTTGLLLDAFPALENRMSQRAGYLSGGERQQLAISTALLKAPKVLLIDEMSLGLSPLVLNLLVAALRRLNRELGLTIVVVEQSVHMAVALAEYVYVIQDGRTIRSMPTSEIEHADEFAALYLGVDTGE